VCARAFASGINADSAPESFVGVGAIVDADNDGIVANRLGACASRLRYQRLCMQETNETTGIMPRPGDILAAGAVHRLCVAHGVLRNCFRDVMVYGL
jgi:hypothetical protein